MTFLVLKLVNTIRFHYYYLLKINIFYLQENNLSLSSRKIERKFGILLYNPIYYISPTASTLNKCVGELKI